MRRVVAYMLVSLDGVAQDPETFVLDWDDAMDANLARVIGRQTTVLLGRRMYDQWSRYWPESDDQPFADFINTVDKRIATSSPLDVPWPRAVAIEGDVLDAVRALRDSDDEGDVGVHGSIELTQSLLAAGLVDDLHLLVAPAAVGTGRRLWTDDITGRFTLAGSEASPSGALLLHYRRR